MKGTVEVDETYVGARFKRGTERGHPGPESNKTPVVALVARGTGRVRAFATPPVTSETLKTAIRENTYVSTRIVTDEFNTYPAATHLFQPHDTLNHRSREYVQTGNGRPHEHPRRILLAAETRHQRHVPSAVDILSATWMNSRSVAKSQAVRRIAARWSSPGRKASV